MANPATNATAVKTENKRMRRVRSRSYTTNAAGSDKPMERQAQAIKKRVAIARPDRIGLVSSNLRPYIQTVQARAAPAKNRYVVSDRTWSLMESVKALKPNAATAAAANQGATPRSVAIA